MMRDELTKPTTWIRPLAEYEAEFNRRRNTDYWPRLCERVGDEGCEAALTEADEELGQCSNCGRKLNQTGSTKHRRIRR